MNQIPTYILTGFLGSGKTTLVKRILDNYSEKKKVAVIQNEFAPHNFDSQDLKRHTNREFDLLEINNGSVFCVCLLSDFIPAFSKFVSEYKPDIVIFEASGLSDPIAVGELFNSPLLQKKVYLAGSICVVDASVFLKLEKLQQRVAHQVQIADKIILNKTDLEANFQPVLDKLNELNPQSKKYISTYCKIDLQTLFFKESESSGKSRPSFQISAEDIGRPDIRSIVYKSTKSIKHANHMQFLEEVSSKMVRLKGYLLLNTGETLAVQYSGNQLKTEKIERKIKQTELIAMGHYMSDIEVKNIYLQYC